MPDKYHALRSVLIAALLPPIVAGKMGSAEPALTEQTLKVIEDCMARSPAPWPDEWRQEYVDTIRRAIVSHQNAPHYAVRLEILRKGFAPYLQGFKKTPERSLFEVRRAQIRWYIEHLMGTKFPSEAERKKLRDQYTDIWDYAANTLLVQFPFLEPNAVQAAKADHLNQCYRKIEAPLLPIYLRALSEEQVGQIKPIESIFFVCGEFPERCRNVYLFHSIIVSHASILLMPLGTENNRELDNSQVNLELRIVN